MGVSLLAWYFARISRPRSKHHDQLSAYAAAHVTERDEWVDKLVVDV